MLRPALIAAACLLIPACATTDATPASAAITAPAYAPPDYATAPLDLSTPEATAYSMMVAM